MLSLLVMLFSSTAWADSVMGYYNSETKELNFYGQGEVDADVIGTYVTAEAKQNATSITFDSYITGIAENAFENFPNLETITIPTNITKIESFAFKYCPKLKTIMILGSNTATTLSLGQYAFYKKPNATNAKLTFTLARQVECLEYYTKKPSSNLFTPDNTYLESIVIAGNYVQSIPEMLFINCKGLTTVTFSHVGNLKSIGTQAFQECTELTTLSTDGTSGKLPDAITTIAVKAFYDCSKLAKVSFSTTSNLTTIGKEAFENTGITSLTIPGKVTSIGTDAFKNNSELATVTIREGVTSIPNNIFLNCYKLSSLSLPSTLKTIGDGAFKYNMALKTVNLPSGLTTIGSEAFAGAGLTSIDLSRVTNLGTFAFQDCKSLTSVTLSQTISNIPSGIFAGTKLTTITIPATANIGAEAFKNCTELQSIQMDRFSGNSIHFSAFEGCSKLTSFPLLRAGLQFIGASAFKGSGLTEISFDPTITANTLTIGDNAFEGTKLTSISLPGRLTKLGNNAFKNCSELTSITLESSETTLSIGSYAFIRYNSTKPLTFICNRPYSYEGDYGTSYGSTMYENTATGAQSPFYRETLLTSVTFGGKATEIPYRSFEGCTGLTSVSIANAPVLSYIGNSAFKDCTNLTSITLPETLKTIAGAAFSGTKLTKITIPAATTSIGTSAFENVALTSLTCADGTAGLSIKNKAFYGAKFQSISIPSRVTSIGEEAFRNCDDVTSIEFAANTTSMEIGTYAFAKSNNATKTYSFSCNRPFSYTSESNGGITDKGAYGLFANDNLINSATFGGDATSIPYRTFYGCTGLTSFSIEEDASVSTIEPYAFMRTNLQGDINIPESVTKINSGAFGDIPNQLDVYVDNTPEGITIAEDAFSHAFIHYRGDVPYDQWIASFTEDERLAMTELTIPNNSVANHGYNSTENLFTLFPNVTDLTFGENVTMVGDYIFSGQASSIYEPTVTPKLQHVTFKNNPEIGVNAFRYCTELASVTGTVKSVSNNSFFMCSALTSITITEDDVIEKGAFLKCKALTTVNLPQNLTTIVGQAFWDCASLKNIKIPSSVTTIGYQAFLECHSLESIELPSGIESIGDQAFAYNENLSKVTCHNATSIEISSYVFASIAPDAILYVPSEGLAAYNANASWKNNFVSILEIPSGDVENIHWSYEDGVLAFSGKGEMPASTAWNTFASTATSIVFGSGITKIKENTFQNLSALQSVTIPYSMGEIGTGAFKNSTLKEVNLALPVNANSNASEAIYHFSQVKNVGALTAGKGALLLSVGGRQLTESDEITYPEFSKNPNKDAVRYFSNIYNLRITCYQQDIPASYFANWKYLKNVIIDDIYVEEIGMNAFSNSGIEGIILTSRITKIGNDAFYNCTHLKNVEMYDGVEIGNEAFMSCSIENLKITFRDGGNAITFTNIASDSHQPFYGATIKNINLCHNTTDVANKDGYALERWCGTQHVGYLTSARPADGIKLSLNGVEWDETKMFVLPIYLYHTNGALNAFSNVKRLQLANTLTGVYGINASEYANNTFLKEVEIPAGVNSIGSNAFANSGLEKVTILGVPEIESGAFSNTPLKDLTLQNAAAAGTYFKGMSTLEQLTLCSGTLPDQAFANCANLKTIAVGPSVTMGSAKNSFSGTPYRTINVINDAVHPTLLGKEIWTSLILGNSYGKTLLFDGNEKEVVVLDYETVLPRTFQNITNVKKVVLTDKVKYAGDYCFNSNIKHITCYGNPYHNGGTYGILTSSSTKTTTVHFTPDCKKLNYDWSSKFNVLYNAGDVTLNLSEANADEEGPIQLEVVNLEGDVIWSTNGSGYASVNANGLVTLNKDFVYNGQTDCLGIVTATVGGKSADFKVEFTPTTVVLTDGQPYVNSKDFEVERVTYTRTFSDKVAGKWQCLYVPFDITVTEELLKDFEFAKLYMISYKDANDNGEIEDGEPLVMLLMKQTEGKVLHANTPYFIKAKTSGTKSIEVESATLKPAENGTVYCCTTEHEYTLTGIYNTFNVKGNYTLTTNGLFSYYTVNQNIKPNRWYMQINSLTGEGDENTEKARQIILMVDGEDETTGVMDIAVGSKASATEGIFTIDGRKVNETENLPHGLYIKNGKKVVIK